MVLITFTDMAIVGQLSIHKYYLSNNVKATAVVVKSNVLVHVLMLMISPYSISRLFRHTYKVI